MLADTGAIFSLQCFGLNAPYLFSPFYLFIFVLFLDAIAFLVLALVLSI